MQRLFKILTAVIVLFCFCRLSKADEIIFTNGDRLTGTLKQITDGMVLFNSDIAGEVEILLEKVLTFSSDSTVEMHFRDGTVIKRPVKKSESGKIAIEGDETLKTQEFYLSSLTSINPPARPKPRWKGNVTAGLSYSQGNTNRNDYSLNLNLNRRGHNDRITFTADYAQSKEEDANTGQDTTTQDWWRLKTKYDYFISPKVYGYTEAAYEKDSIAKLERRVLVGAGGGYQWIESQKMNFSTEAGIASVYEKHENVSDGSSDFSAKLGYHFNRIFTSKLEFINDLSFYPSFAQFSDYYLTTAAELRAKINQQMFTNFRAMLDYDASPAEGSEKTDIKYTMGAGWIF
jgi:putative salt-induced outer membrane protein YdiY